MWDLSLHTTASVNADDPPGSLTSLHRLLDLIEGWGSLGPATSGLIEHQPSATRDGTCTSHNCRTSHKGAHGHGASCNGDGASASERQPSAADGDWGGANAYGCDDARETRSDEERTTDRESDPRPLLRG